MPAKKRDLNGKQKRFVDEYLVDLDATKAAIRAGYAPNSAAQTGYKLAHKGLVATAIACAQAERSRRTGIAADRVLRELARIAFVDPAKIINFETAEVLPDVAEDDRAVLSGVKVKYIPHKDFDEDGQPIVEQAIEREVKFCDKLKALDMLAKHLGMYEGAGIQGSDEEKQTGVVLLPPVQPLAPPVEDETPPPGETEAEQ